MMALNVWANPVDDLLERVDKGASKKFKTELVKSEKDFFELDQQGQKVVIPLGEGNRLDGSARNKSATCHCR